MSDPMTPTTLADLRAPTECPGCVACRCGAKQHAIDEQHRLRGLLRSLEASSESLLADVERLTRERDEARAGWYESDATHSALLADSAKWRTIAAPLRAWAALEATEDDTYHARKAVLSALAATEGAG